MVPITIEACLDMSVRNNPGLDRGKLEQKLQRYVQHKQAGHKCESCGNDIWALGSAIVDWDACFSCITGESDSDAEYEIDVVFC